LLESHNRFSFVSLVSAFLPLLRSSKNKLRTWMRATVGDRGEEEILHDNYRETGSSRSALALAFRSFFNTFPTMLLSSSRSVLCSAARISFRRDCFSSLLRRFVDWCIIGERFGFEGKNTGAIDIELDSKALLLCLPKNRSKPWKTRFRLYASLDN
jgi:hypothetical protein